MRPRRCWSTNGDDLEMDMPRHEHPPEDSLPKIPGDHLDDTSPESTGNDSSGNSSPNPRLRNRDIFIRLTVRDPLPTVIRFSSPADGEALARIEWAFGV